jgi:hypothetical protein
VPGIKHEAKCCKSKELKMKVLKDIISYSSSHRSARTINGAVTAAQIIERLEIRTW